MRIIREAEFVWESCDMFLTRQSLNTEYGTKQLIIVLMDSILNLNKRLEEIELKLNKKLKRKKK